MQQRSGLSRRAQIIFVVICMIGGIAVGLFVWFEQFYTEETSETTVPAPPPEATPPPPESEVASVPLRPDGSPYPAIFIPSAGVSEYIIESRLESTGWRVDHLGNRVGHLEGTTAVGESGNIVLAGHVENSEGRAAVFSNLGDLEIGASVTLSEGEVMQHYAVTEVKVVPNDDLSVVYDVGDDRVTLITCTGYNLLTDSYDERVVVVAHRVE